VRADLLALTTDALAGLANRGLVKRATKELDTVPPVTVAEDGTVEATFADGAHVSLPPGHGLDTAHCTCGAPGICRHRIGAVLAYQRDHESAPVVVLTGWPGSVTDEELTAQFGARTLTAARRAISGGLTARVRRQAMTVETPSATVRFLVPGELGFVDCDARAESRDALVVLAVWAFRRADERQPDDPDVTVEFAGRSEEVPPAMAGAATAAVELLRIGVVSADDVLAAALRREHAACEKANLRWPAGALADLVDQLTAYGTRSAQHDPLRVAELIAELHARNHAAGQAPSRVLGTDEPAETPLRQVRLVALGCRAGHDPGDDEDDAGTDTAEVFLAHPGTETVLAVRHRWPGGGGATAARRLAGTTLASLAAGNVVSEAAVRSAGRVVRFGAGRLARTTVSPVGESWAELPRALRPSVTEALAQLTGLPPRVVRPRVAAELVRVVPVTEVRQVRYHAGAQRLDALIADADGMTATVSLAHRTATPGALDALAGALAGEPVEVSGAIRRAGGGLVIEPYAVRTAGGVVVLDLATATGAVPPAAGHREPDPLAAAIEQALTFLAEAAHRGLTRLPPTFAARATPIADALTRTGLTRCADAVRAWAADQADPVTWLRAEIRLLTAAELA
jgi:hypothetical protein